MGLQRPAYSAAHVAALTENRIGFQAARPARLERKSRLIRFANNLGREPDFSYFNRP
jgi:hypothetical protein